MRTMSLARTWTRHMFGASGVALLAPVTMIAALAILALGGGFGGLGALGQLISGPAVPVSSPSVRGGTTLRTAPPVLPAVPTSAAAGRAPTRVASATFPAGSRTSGSRGGAAPGARRGRGGGGAQGLGRGGQGSTQHVPPPPPPTKPAPPVTTPAPPPSEGPVHTLVNTVVGVGVSVTSQLPAPVAAIGTGALLSIGQTLDALLAPLP